MAKYRVSHPGFYVFSVISLAILLVLSGFLISALVFQDFYNKKFREDITLLAELRENLSDSEVEEVEKKIAALPEVAERSVRFVSRNEALSEIYGDLGEDVAIDGMENPFSDMVTFSLNAESFEIETMQLLSEKIESEMPVRQVHYPSDYFDNAFEILKTLKTYLIIFILIALGMTGILIHHIMRLNVVAQQRQIKTMELVGAKPSFIRRPFIRTGLRMGFSSWLVALIVSAGVWFAFLGPKGFVLWGLSLPGLVGAGVLLVVALAVCGVTTHFAVTRSLRTSILRDN